MTITTLGMADLQWEFDEKGPHVLIGRGDHPRKVRVDPFPCYTHDAGRVSHEFARVQSLFPISRPPHILILPVDSEAHANGWTQHDAEYDPDEERYGHPLPTIVLAGKRTPIHPAMTRYLVAHEYGHAVETWLSVEAGHKAQDDAHLREYAELRGLPYTRAYGGGTWHAAPAEVFADDFRLLVTGAETEFWPHPGIARPEGLPQIIDYWRVRQAAVAPSVTREDAPVERLVGVCD